MKDSLNDLLTSYHFASKLKDIRIKYLIKITIAQICMNSTRNKFELLSLNVKNNIDILLIIETKIKQTFPNSQILLEDYSWPFRLERNELGGDILVFITDDIPYLVLTVSHTFESLIFR